MTRLTQRAEEALLGAMLFRPTAVPSLRWIPPQAFSRPDHAALWRTLHGIDFRNVPASEVPTTVSAAIEQIEDQGIRQCLTPARLTELARACPAPRSAPLYAGMTLDAAIHRGIEHAGGHLRDVARETEVEQAPRALDRAAATEDRLAALGRAWAAAPETVRNLLDTRPDEPVALAPRTDRARTDVQAEAETVASLLYEPRQVREVPWLQGQDFSDPQLRAVYQAMSTLDDRQAPIDPLTVGWEMQRHPGPHPSVQLLDDLEHSGVPGTAPHTAHQVLDTAVVDRIDAAGHDLRAHGRHPGLAPSALLEGAEQAMEPVAADRERFHAFERETTPEPSSPPAEHTPQAEYEMEL